MVLETYRLFSYGTLQDPDIQKILFDHQLIMQRATLKDWRLYCRETGYLFIRPEKGFSVEGFILTVTEDELWIADQWEEVPKYDRVMLPSILTDGNICEVWAYIQPHGKGKPVSSSILFSLPKEQVLQQVRAFKSSL
ncbi:MAG: gamma-glutamylcyclotransferase family protein [Thermotaleaceae bacterium]